MITISQNWYGYCPATKNTTLWYLHWCCATLPVLLSLQLVKHCLISQNVCQLQNHQQLCCAVTLGIKYFKQWRFHREVWQNFGCSVSAQALGFHPLIWLFQPLFALAYPSHCVVAPQIVFGSAVALSFERLCF